jgi:hypothetical protein
MKSRAEAEKYAKERAKTDPLWRKTEELLARLEKKTPAERAAARAENMREPPPEEREAIVRRLDARPVILN